MKDIKYKIFPWWLIVLLVYSILSALSNIRRYGIEGCSVNLLIILVVIAIITVRCHNKDNMIAKEKEKDNNITDSDKP